MVWMRQMHVLVITTYLFHLAYQVLSCKNYEAWINNMHVSMQALRRRHENRVRYSTTLSDGEGAGEDGREESDERGKVQKIEEEKRREPGRWS